MKEFPLIILFTPFVGFLVTTLIEFHLTKEILKLVKDIDHRKYEKLTFFFLPLLSEFMWVRPYRFIKFIKEGNFYDNPKLIKKAAAFKKNRKMGYIFWGAFMILMVLFGALGGIASS